MSTNPETEIHIPDEAMKVPETMQYHDSNENKGSQLVRILSISIVCTLLALAGLYIFDMQTQTDTPAVAIPARPTADQNQEPESDNARADVETMQALSPSDQLSTIITDLENTDISDIDAELSTIEAELE